MKIAAKDDLKDRFSTQLLNLLVWDTDESEILILGHLAYRE